jgi:hypothetical protein
MECILCMCVYVLCVNHPVLYHYQQILHSHQCAWVLIAHSSGDVPEVDMCEMACKRESLHFCHCQNTVPSFEHII